MITTRTTNKKTKIHSCVLAPLRLSVLMMLLFRLEDNRLPPVLIIFSFYMYKKKILHKIITEEQDELEEDIAIETVVVLQDAPDLI